MPPVRDCEGHVVWRVRVTANEMTCLDCGEIATHSHDSVGNPLTYCPRCTTDEELDGEERLDLRRNARLVPTMSYLREGEWTQ